MSALAILAAQAGGAPGQAKSAAEANLELWGRYSLADPWVLLLVPVALALLWIGRRRRLAGRVPTLPTEASLPRSVEQRLAWLPTLLQGAALCCVIIGLARPLAGDKNVSSTSEGVDIALLIDRSSSMQHQDLAPGRTRLDVVKEVVGEFAKRRMTDREGAADSIALITFGRYPQLLCPLTLDVDAAPGFLADVDLVQNRPEDGTGIGIALAKAVSVLRELAAKSKVCVLLTDGANNIDRILPRKAAELAAEEGVKVYTVLAGRYVYTYDAFGNVRPQDIELDDSELREIADLTGGRFFRARDRASLEEVYAEIEALERTPRQVIEHAEYWDLYPRWLSLALILYVAGWFSTATWARRLP